MDAKELLRAGKLKEAIQALSLEVRDHPADTRRRTFLFELLCFAGEFDRAAKQIDVLAQASPDAEIGASLYRLALAAERTRQALFEEKQYPNQAVSAVAGTLDGEPFETLEDADPRIGPRLEIFLAGEYLWLPFEHIGSIQLGTPKLLRDLLWATAHVTPGPGFENREFGDVLLPALCPLSWRHAADEVRLGRITEWQEEEELGAIPFGQKLLIADGDREVPFLGIRELVFHKSEETL